MRAGRCAPGVVEPIGESPAVRALRSEIAAVAGLGSTVLLTGETGVGKGVVAREIHRCSRRPGPLVHVDCAGLAPGLVESELFGHERGAFTGAVACRPGRFELAGSGTIFLDEIGELEPALQAKLLRVLQDREFERLGGGRTRTMPARVIAATSRDLRRAVQAGRFRADLYFRIAVVHLALPPLRERRADIPLLARAFLARLAKDLELPPALPSPDFLERLAAHPWPGNARELHNVLERVLIRCAGGALRPADLEGALDPPLRPADLEGALDPPLRPADLEGALDPPLAAAADPSAAPPAPSAERIRAVLEQSGGNVALAARRLGLSRTTLRRRIRRHFGDGGQLPLFGGPGDPGSDYSKS
jgi:transcriptional regulator with GAF, ATPase, and Fis domain